MTVSGNGWFADNADGLITSHVHMSENGGGNVAQNLEATLYVPKFTFVTPAGCPVTEPKATIASGGNQFTFSAAPTGKLEMFLQVKVEPPEAAALIAEHCVFTVGNIGNSVKKWDIANPNGKPTVGLNGMLEAVVIFEGLPQNNDDFGWKMAELWMDGTLVASNRYGVFFDKHATNHGQSCPTCANCENWFYYWRQGGVCGIPFSNCVFDPLLPFNVVAQVNYVTGLISFGSRAASEDLQSPYTFTALDPLISPPLITVGGSGKGIQFVAENLQHEYEHLYVRQQLNMLPDSDGDGIPDQMEASYKGIMTSPNNPDTYHIRFRWSQYALSGDQELRARRAETDKTITLHPERDWANPGSQHANQFGPKVNP